MARTKPITVEGKQYQSVRAVAEAYNFNESKFRDRLRYDWTPEEALELVPRKAFVRKQYDLIIDRKRYDNFAELGAAFGVDGNKVRNRYNNGWTLRQAVELDSPPRKEPRKNVIEFEGKKYPNRSELSRAHSVEPSKVQSRLIAGWTMRQALELDPAPKRRSWRRNPDIINGRAYPKANGGRYLLYLITCLANDKEYVGVTTGTLEKRLGEHISNAKNTENGQFVKLYRAIRKYGTDQFKIELLRDDAKDYRELLLQEQEEVAKRNSFTDGYNSTPGGETTSTARELTVGDMTFPTLTSAAAHFGVDEFLIRSRIDSLGWTVEQAVEIDPRPTDWGAKEVTVEDKTYPSFKDAAKAYGLAYSKVHLRVTRYGWTVEQALGVEERIDAPPGAPKEIEFRGVSYRSNSELARAYDMDPAKFSARTRKGWTIEQALGLKEPPKRIAYNKKSITVNGQVYETQRAAAKAYGQDYRLVSAKLRKGWTPEEALGLVKHVSPHPGAPKETEFRGLIYKSNAALARAFGIKPSTYRDRMRSGWTIEDALELNKRDRKNLSI